MPAGGLRRPSSSRARDRLKTIDNERPKPLDHGEPAERPSLPPARSSAPRIARLRPPPHGPAAHGPRRPGAASTRPDTGGYCLLNRNQRSSQTGFLSTQPFWSADPADPDCRVRGWTRPTSTILHTSPAAAAYLTPRANARRTRLCAGAAPSRRARATVRRMLGGAARAMILLDWLVAHHIRMESTLTMGLKSRFINTCGCGAGFPWLLAHTTPTCTLGHPQLHGTATGMAHHAPF